MKKGISLIVLVITIIVMIIIAGAIIISLNSTSVIDKANKAVTGTDVQAINNQLQLAYVDLKLEDAYKTKNDFTESTQVTVGGATTTLKAYYEGKAPELANLATKYSEYKLVIGTNGAASVVKK